MSSDELDIGEVIERSGVPASTLHVWERHGLIEPCGRVGLRRQYPVGVMTTIAIIVVCQRSNFSLAEIKALLQPEAFAGGKQLLTEKLTELRTLQSQISDAITGLEHALDCTAPSPLACPGFERHLTNVLPVAGLT